ncbi:hypothetical protein Hamer_G016942, partial [Homarus americanus]
MFKSHTAKSIAKANQSLGKVKRTFTYINEVLFKTLYLTYVRLHLEYCVQTLYHGGEIDSIEKVQKRATKIVPSLTNLSYGERLAKLVLTILEERRSRGLYLDDITTHYKSKEQTKKKEDTLSVNEQWTDGIIWTSTVCSSGNIR